MLSPCLNVSGLGGEPDEVGSDEGHAGAHDGEKRPEAAVRFQRLPGRALKIKSFRSGYPFCSTAVAR